MIVYHGTTPQNWAKIQESRVLFSPNGHNNKCSHCKSGCNSCDADGFCRCGVTMYSRYLDFAFNHGGVLLALDIPDERIIIGVDAEFYVSDPMDLSRIRMIIYDDRDVENIPQGAERKFLITTSREGIGGQPGFRGGVFLVSSIDELPPLHPFDLCEFRLVHVLDTPNGFTPTTDDGEQG